MFGSNRKTGVAGADDFGDPERGTGTPDRLFTAR
jgi:hypothetical protein